MAQAYLGSAEATLVDDFLSFGDDQFSYLNLYDTFGKCRGTELTQARVFFARFQSQNPSGFFGLEGSGWSIEPNLHFSYIRRHLAWVETAMSDEAYFEYWRTRTIGQMQRDSDGTFTHGLKALATDGVMKDEGIPAVLSAASKSGALNLNVNPGFAMVFRWPLGRAKELDAHFGMVDVVFPATTSAF